MQTRRFTSRQGLEEELKVRLFERHGRGMLITDAGRETLAHAKKIMVEVGQIRSSISGSKAAISGRVVVGMPPTVAEIISVPLVLEVRKVHPKVELSFVTAFTGYLLDWLQKGDVDIAVLYDPHSIRAMQSQPLLIESLFLVGPSDADLSLQTSVPFEKLGGLKMLLPSARHGLRAICEKCAAQASVALDVEIESESLYTLKDLVRNGFGYTILPLAPIHTDLADAKLTAAPLCLPAAERRLALSFASGRPVSRASQFGADSITAVASELVSREVWAGRLIKEA